MARALLLESADLVNDPGRPPGWVNDDPAVLQGAGATSAAIPGVIRRIAPQLDVLRDGGFVDVRVPERTWSAPVELVCARKPG